MKKYIYYAGALLLSVSALQSCSDFDDPGDELGFATIQVETTKYVGNVDTIPYTNQPTEEGVANAISELKSLGYLGNSITGQYCMRGGKEGDIPAAHAYQRQYSLGPDAYAGYFVVPHKDFMYGTLTSSYNVSADFNSGPLGNYTMVKNALMPLLNHPLVDSIPEIKAINLIYYCVAAQEMADLSGPFTYLEDKQNSEAPYVYNDLRTIYHGIVENIDTAVACLKHYDTRPDWYKKEIEQVMSKYCETSRSSGMDSYIRLANSLKLRMAMRIVKVEPETAQKWAEDAVASGVVESVQAQQGLFPVISGFAHPLVDIANSWGDLRLCASFESLLMSLDHPYTKYFFKNNSNKISYSYLDEEGNPVEVVTPADSRICGIRAGVLVGDGQTYPLNQRQAYSSFDNEIIRDAPLYFVKFSEVDFLRAEGALRGWNMGGSAQSFYERGILNAYLDEPDYMWDYNDYVNDYMQQEAPIDYVNVDPLGDGDPWPSVTKIGVKWNEADDAETKLEKIITQKYIALFPLSTEAWAEYRRTGYPRMFDVLNVDDGDGSLEQGDIIRRIPWAATDPQVINMIEATGIPALGGEDAQATRLWWDVDKSNF